jgi:hypothetical protein
MSARILNVVLALWAGSLAAICGIVAPALFMLAPDRHLAGEMAGYFFRLESWLGLAFGGLAIFLLAMIRSALSRTTVAMVTIGAAAPIINEVAVRPFMESARAAGNMSTFGLLHGAGAILFLIACCATLALVWRFSRPAT